MAQMRRAAGMAREIANQTNTEIVRVRDGKPVKVSAAELRKGLIEGQKPLGRRSTKWE